MHVEEVSSAVLSLYCAWQSFHLSILIAGLASRAESFPLLKATFVPGQTLNENHAYKRCASHVYIARFIEYQTNKNR